MGQRMLIFGDSIAWGKGDNELGGWVERFKLDLLKNSKLRIYNLGIQADATEEILNRFDTELHARQVANPIGLIMFAIGVNDSQYIETPDNRRTTLETFKKNITELYNKAKKTTDQIYFVGLLNVDESKTMPIPWREGVYYTAKDARAYNETLRQVCTETGATFIDVFDLVDFADMPDGLHPNAQGHRKIFEKVKSQLKY